MQVRLDLPKSTSFGAINRKYLRKAHEQFEGYKNILSYWNESLGGDVFLFKRTSEKDARDTVKVVENYVNPGTLPSYKRYFSEFYENRAV